METGNQSVGNPVSTNERPHINQFLERPVDSVHAERAPFGGVEEPSGQEGQITKKIEAFTSKVPSGTFLSLAFASIGVSAFLQLIGRKNDAQFVGQWVPTILIMGLYNKLVKLEGSEGQKA